MYDNDDIRFSPAEERPPWELDAAGSLREDRNCRKVDDATAGYCQEVEEQKQARIQAQAQRSAAYSDFERQRAEAQQRLTWEQEAARQRMDRAHAEVQQRRAQLGMDQPSDDAAPPVTPPPYVPGDGRYVFAEPPQNGPNRRSRAKAGSTAQIVVVCVVIFLCMALILLLRGIFGGSGEESGRYDEAPYSDERGDTEPDDDASGVTPPAWEGEFPWGAILPENDEDDEAAPATEIPRAELDGSLSLDVRSAAGKQPLTYQALYEQCLPSTVSITVYTKDGGGTGTGIVMTEDGYILTCNHVVEGGLTCEVTTWDDQVYDALLVGGDAQTDLAVLKIDAAGLKPAEFGDSDELTVGDEALAIGDPLGTELRGTLTNGIISAINRNVTMNSYSMTLLQTTAALNSGNSGGPLINIYGQVVGVNNMKMVSDDVTVEGLGFAVPTSVVKDIVPILSAEGKVSRPVLGITCYGIDARAAERDEEPTTGLKVVSINPASNATEQGLQVDDYIFSVNGVEVVSVPEVKDVLENAKIGDDVELLVYRLNDDGELEELHITITLMDQADLR